MTTMHRIGDTIGAYRIVRELGLGGMGIVYEALDTTLDRHIALKIINPSEHYAHEDLDAATIRFQREAKLAASLNHPNLVTVHALDAVDNVLLLAMELVEGKSLAELLAQGERWDPQKAAVLLFEISEGVAAAHEAGIVHRDLKPSNVMIAPNGRPKVLDFGVAGRLGDATPNDAPNEGSEFGTINYMAPEQVSGGSIGPWTDVFAIGAIGYELVTGVPAFGEGSPITVGMRVTSETPPLLADAGLANEQFGVLTQILKRSVAKNPKDRFADGRSLASGLRSIVASSPVSESLEPGTRANNRLTNNIGTRAFRRVWDEAIGPLASRVREIVDPFIDRAATWVFQQRVVSRLLPEGGLPAAVTRRITLLGVGLLLVFGMTTVAAIARAGGVGVASTSTSPLHVLPVRTEVIVVGPPQHELLGTSVNESNWARLTNDSVLLRFSKEGFVPQRVWFSGSPIFVDLDPAPTQLCGVIRASPPGTQISTDDPTQRSAETSSVLCVREPDSILVALSRPGYTSRSIWFKGPDLHIELETERVPVRFENNRVTATTGSTPASQPVSTTGVLRVWVENGWARVSVDGSPTKLTATTFPNLSVGPHVLVLSRPGGQSRIDTVRVQPLDTPNDTTRVGYSADLGRRINR